MSKRLFSTLCLAAGGLLAGAAGAAPTLVYQFTTHEIATNCGTSCSFGSFREDLDQMVIGLKQSFRQDGSASLSIEKFQHSPVMLTNDDVARLELMVFPSYTPVNIPVEPAQWPVHESWFYFRMDMALAPSGNKLTGFLDILETNNQLVMDMSTDRLARYVGDPGLLLQPSSRTEWTGYASSDEFMNQHMYFTGEWRLVDVVRDVPEPGSLALLLGALGLMGSVTHRYRRTRP